MSEQTPSLSEQELRGTIAHMASAVAALTQLLTDPITPEQRQLLKTAWDEGTQTFGFGINGDSVTCFHCDSFPVLIDDEGACRDCQAAEQSYEKFAP